MGNLQEEQAIVGDQIFEEVIYRKHLSNITTKKICEDLNIEKRVVNDYLSGASKKNFPLGILILDYLEQQELALSNDYE